MRAILIALAIVATLHPAFAAERDESDAYYACLVGNAAVEVLNGLESDAAVEAASVFCEAEAKALDGVATGDMGSDADAVYEAALAVADRLAE